MNYLKNSKEEIVEVEVLLATFNGEAYLAEQLDSVANQIGVVVNLIVSDDGSTDSTLRILESFRTKFNSFQVLQGPRLGPSANFMYLLSRSNGRIIAFCDQDDIWNPLHLKKSVASLDSDPSTPKLTFSSMTPFQENQTLFEPWPSLKFKPNLHSFIAENHARGCTIVMNHRAAQLIKSKPPRNPIMHDWWCALVVLTCGQILFLNEPHIKYRIHDGNFTKKTESRLHLKIKFVRTRIWSPLTQIKEVFQLHYLDMNPEERASLEKLLRSFDGDLSERILGLSLNKHRFRFKLVDEILLRIGFLFKLKS
jgi:glycosyltransferase involved in cell wall biosynthesis